MQEPSSSALNGPNLAFLHIPKNAGSAIEDAARKLGVFWGRWAVRNHTRVHVGDGCPYYHLPIDALPEPHAYQGRAVFCVIRSPFARAVSQYGWLHYMQAYDSAPSRKPHQRRRHSMQLPPDQQSFSSRKRCTVLGLNEYLRQELSSYAAAKNATRRRQVGNCHFLPNSRFVWTGEGRRACQFVLNHSTLEHDFDALMREHGLGIRYLDMSSHAQKLSSASLAAACKKLVPSDIDADNVRRMQRIYSDDFSRLGFWPWPGG